MQFPRQALFMVIISLVLYSSCSVSRNAAKYSNVDFDIQAFRGGNSSMPANTVESMIRSLGTSANTIHMEAELSKDKQLVMSKVSASGEGKWQLVQVLDSLQRYMMASRRPIPNYHIQLITYPDKAAQAAPAELIDPLMSIINEKGIAERVIIGSYDTRILKYLHSKYPGIRTALFADARSRSSFRKSLNDLGFSPTIYSPELTMVNAALIRNTHGRNIKVIPWTVNDRSKLESLKNMGVDGVLSNDVANLAN